MLRWDAIPRPSMKSWPFFALTVAWFCSVGHATEVEFRALFVAAPLPIQTSSGKNTHQPGLVTLLTPTAQKTLLDELSKSQPAPATLSLPSVTSPLQTKSALSVDREQTSVDFSARVDCEAQAITDSRITVILRPQAATVLPPSKREPQAITIPDPSSKSSGLSLPPEHTDQLVVRTLINTSLPSGDWALIYLGQIDQKDGIPRHFYAFVSATVVP